MSTDTRARIEATLRCHLTPIAHDQTPHKNTHYKGTRSDGTALFVKVIEDHPSYYTAELRAHHHLEADVIPTPRLVDHGAVDDKRRWLAYEWHELKPFTPSTDNIERAGRLLGDLHATTSGVQDDQLRRYADVHELITDKIALIAGFDPPLSERIRKIRDRLFARGQASPGNRVCLLHGDMGWRNLHMGPRDQLWLLDFEHSAIGHPLLDFAKLWDRELHAHEDREAFLTGYSRSEVGPVRHDEIDTVRLWAAAGIFPYARPREDHDFERHAYVILDRLENRR